MKRKRLSNKDFERMIDILLVNVKKPKVCYKKLINYESERFGQKE